MMETIDAHLAKPDPLICPKRYCFHWLESGTTFAPGLFENLGAALASATGINEGQCGCSFGVCRRVDSAPANRDWYEPHEPNLEMAELSWFFFIPAPDNLYGQVRRRYICESEQLWGKGHWQR